MIPFSLFARRQNRILILSLFVLAILATGCAGAGVQATATIAPTAVPTNVPTEATEEIEGMEGMDMGDVPVVPAGFAYAEGQEIRFIHTEVSDPEVAELLSGMMDSPVLLVESLAKAPKEMLANVYVFTNGPEGMGPLGFAPDVFDNPPGTEGYSPLRALNLVTWQDENKARELKSAAEVLEAESSGEVTIEQPGVVINMPFITWPGGER